MKYSELREINVNEHTEDKNGFTYLSWAWAVDVLLQKDETATWDYSFFGPEEDRRPYCRIGDGAMVFCTVRAFERTKTAQMPVLDHRNRAIADPDSFAVNTAMMRALAKAISLHGIGLYIYAGEDLPDSEAEHLAKKDVQPTTGAGEGLSATQKEVVARKAQDVLEAVTNAQMATAHDIATGLDGDEKIYLWSLLDSKTRSAMKKYSEKVKQEQGHVKDHLKDLKKQFPNAKEAA